MATELSNELDFEIKVKKPKSYILTDPKAIFRIQMAKTRRKVQEMTLRNKIRLATGNHKAVVKLVY